MIESEVLAIDMELVIRPLAGRWGVFYIYEDCKDGLVRSLDMSIGTLDRRNIT